MSYRFAYPNATPAVGAAPAHGYGVDPGSMMTGYSNGAGTNMYSDRPRRSYSRRSFSSDSGSDDGYEYRGRLITRETRCPRDIVRAPTPPPIIKRVVERAPTPEARVMERVIIRPQAQEIVERVIEQPRTPPPRIIQKEMHEEAPPPIVRTRVIKVDRPLHGGYSQSSAPFSNPFNGMMEGGNAYRASSVAGSTGRPVAFHNALNNNQSYSSASSFEYAPSTPGAPVSTATMMTMPPAQQAQPVSAMQNQQVQPISFMQSSTVPTINMMQQQPAQSMNMMQQQQPVQSMNMMQQQPMQSMDMMQQQQPMQSTNMFQQQQPVQSANMFQQQPVQSANMFQQQPVQSMNMFQQQPVPTMNMFQQQPVPTMSMMPQSSSQQQFMFRPVQMQPSIPQMMPQPMSSFPSNYLPQNFMYPGQPGISYGYRPMMQQGGMMSSGMPMMAAGNTLGTPAGSFPTQPFMFNSMPQRSIF